MVLAILVAPDMVHYTPNKVIPLEHFSYYHKVVISEMHVDHLMLVDGRCLPVHSVREPRKIIRILEVAIVARIKQYWIHKLWLLL